MRLIGIGKKGSEVTPLTDHDAVELGADILGELVIYAVASLTIFLEYYRQSKQKHEHEETQEDRLNRLEKNILELEAVGDKQRAEISALTRELHHKIDKLSREHQTAKPQAANPQAATSVATVKENDKVAGLDAKAVVMFFGMFSAILIFIMKTS